MNIGILYPKSNAHPGISLDFMDGLKIFFKQQGLLNDIDFVYDSIGFGGSEKEVYEKTEKLLVLENVDILVAYIDLKVLGILQPLLNASGKLMMVINPGANYPDNWKPQPNIIHLGLQHAFLCWLAGSLAGKLTDRKAIMATTFYDCGYLHNAAMVMGFVKQGGKVMFNYINNQPYNDAFNIKQLTDFLSTDKETRNLLCTFDALPASLLYKQLNECNEAEELQLFVSPMMLEQKALENMPAGFNFPIAGFISWNTAIENESNNYFVDTYLQQTRRTPTIFSLLGWETAMVLQQVLGCKDFYKDGKAVVTALQKITINSPRGKIFLDAQTHYFISPVYKCAIKKHSAKVEFVCIDDPGAEWEAFVNEPSESVSSGWINTYLCY